MKKKNGLLLGIMLSFSVFASAGDLFYSVGSKDEENLQCEKGQTYLAGTTKLNYMDSLDMLFSEPYTTANTTCKTNGNRSNACMDVVKNKGFIITTGLTNTEVLVNAIKQKKLVTFEACISTVGTDGQLFLVNLENSVGTVGISTPGDTFKVVAQKK